MAPTSAARAAELMRECLIDALARRGVGHLALAGGTTPGAAYRLPELEDWSAVQLWFGDERCVGPEDPDSNYGMARRTLLDHAAGAVVHRIAGELGAEAAASAYERELRATLATPDGEPPVLDVVLLGIGEDGHTASLFPGNPALQVVGVACVGVHEAPKPPPDRVSLTLEALRAARSCVLLASGAAKAPALARVLAGALRRGARQPARPCAAHGDRGRRGARPDA